MRRLQHTAPTYRCRELAAAAASTSQAFGPCRLTTVEVLLLKTFAACLHLSLPAAQLTQTNLIRRLTGISRLIAVAGATISADNLPIQWINNASIDDNYYFARVKPTITISSQI